MFMCVVEGIMGMSSRAPCSLWAALWWMLPSSFLAFLGLKKWAEKMQRSTLNRLSATCCRRLPSWYQLSLLLSLILLVCRLFPIRSYICVSFLRQLWAYIYLYFWPGYRLSLTLRALSNSMVLSLAITNLKSSLNTGIVFYIMMLVLLLSRLTFFFQSEYSSLQKYLARRLSHSNLLPLKPLLVLMSDITCGTCACMSFMISACRAACLCSLDVAFLCFLELLCLCCFK